MGNMEGGESEKLRRGDREMGFAVPYYVVNKTLLIFKI
jgi:hypothetical protein